ncbi:MAG: hypothetical protein ACREOG_07495 [Gemmatimonadaceae bacterium]
MAFSLSEQSRWRKSHAGYRLNASLGPPVIVRQPDLGAPGATWQMHSLRAYARKGDVHMTTYLMFGKYSLVSLKDISAKCTEQTVALIQQQGGKLKGAYALLGEVDLVLIVELLDTERAMKTSAALAKLLGISLAPRRQSAWKTSIS